MKYSKRIWNYIGMIFFGGLLGFIAYVSIKSGTVAPDDYVHHTGKLIKKGTITEKGGTKYERTYQEYFYLKIEGVDETLATYNVEENYRSIDSALNQGDMITVVYIPSGTYPNLSLYRIEKEGRVILDEPNKSMRLKIFGYVAAFGVILIIANAIRRDRKHWRR